jgi:hypothetical protein
MSDKPNLAENSGMSVKKKPRGKPFPKGVSGNPKGAPKRGESWAEIIDRIGAMTPIEAAAHANAIAGKLKTMGGAITLKEAVVIRGYAALLFEPSSSLMNIYMDRTDGKVKEKIDLTSGDEPINPYMTMDKAALIALAKKIADAERE